MDERRARSARAASPTAKGAIAAGTTRDLVIWDPDAEFVDVASLEHRNKITPYHARKLLGSTLPQRFCAAKPSTSEASRSAKVVVGRWVR